jgi:hypothetical protein
MNIHSGSTLRLACCALLAALAVPAFAADLPVTDGLVPVKVGSFDKAWQKPGINLKGYTSVLIKPATVAFSRSWRPQDFGRHGLKASDVERIRSSYAAIAEEVLTRVLSKDGYAIARAPAAGVLEVQAEIVDLYVNAPDDDWDVFVRTYVRNIGDMRLLVTLRDSTSGTVLFRGSDFRRGDETGRMEWANNVYNRSEAEQTLGQWARQLKRWMDGVGSSPREL